VQASFAALQDRWSWFSDPGQARVYLWRAVLVRSQALEWHRVGGGGHAPEPAPEGPSAGREASGGPGRDVVVRALGSLPFRQREAVVLRTYLGLSQEQAAEVMSISNGAVNSHLAGGMTLLRRLLGPQ
jgi:DNA-directed RNA polymerase specialized sigma24 family protein